MKYDVSYVHADEQTKEMAPISFGSVHGLFGNASHGMDTSNTAESTNQPASALINYKPFSFFRDVLTLDSLVLLDQVHGIAGQVLTNHNALPTAFTIQGDYLITALPSIGLAVRTADCLPVICTDGTRAVGIAHAGWRGSVAGVQVNMVDRMCELYGVSLQELKVIFGPALGACCYRVDTDFVAHLPGILGDDAGAQVLSCGSGSCFLIWLNIIVLRWLPMGYQMEILMCLVPCARCVICGTILIDGTENKLGASFRWLHWLLVID